MQRFQDTLLMKDERAVDLNPSIINQFYQKHQIKKGLRSQSCRDAYAFLRSLVGNLIEAEMQTKLVALRLSSPVPTPTVKKRILQALLTEGYIREIHRGYFYPNKKHWLPDADLTKIEPTDKIFDLLDSAPVKNNWSVVMRKDGKQYALRGETDENFLLHTFARDFQKRVNVPIRNFRRIYSGSMDKGGRIYSNYQQMPRELRKEIKIDDRQTVELDYRYNQIRMIFAITGEDLEADPYSGFDVPRDQAKSAMNTVVNSKNPKRVFCDMRFGAPFRWSTKIANHFLEQLNERFPLLSSMVGSGVGLKLQKLEGDIALELMKRSHYNTTVALPIHDSFIIPERDAGWFEHEMELVWHEVINKEREKWLLSQNKSFL